MPVVKDEKKNKIPNQKFNWGMTKRFLFCIKKILRNIMVNNEITIQVDERRMVFWVKLFRP
ncbi:hypothetical protein LBMAG01_00770 [Acidobacteriota bacterium]|nr:hypothetical protein LBMAG01_00770 [Acidobacteriota bacterium]